MHEMMWEIHTIMNKVKGFTVGYDTRENKMLFEFEGKRFVAEIREIEDPKPDIRDDMRRIKYL